MWIGTMIINKLDWTDFKELYCLIRVNQRNLIK